MIEDKLVMNPDPPLAYKDQSIRTWVPWGGGGGRGDNYMGGGGGKGKEQLTYTTGACMNEHTLPLGQAPEHHQLKVGCQEHLQ